jgi:hypothetical protein
LGTKFLGMLSTIPQSMDTTRLGRWFNVALSGQCDEFVDTLQHDSAQPGNESVPAGFLEMTHEDLDRSMEMLEIAEPGEFAGLRALLERRPDPREYMVQLTRASEPIPAAVALYVLNQVDSNQAKELADGVLAPVAQNWLVNEVAVSIAGSHGNGTGSAPSPSDASGPTDYEIERADTVSKMLYLLHSSFFRHLGLDALAAIARDAEVRLFQRGGVVCRMGERSDRIFVLCQGSADVFIERNGRSRWVNVVGEGDSIGELGVLTRQPRSASVMVNRDNTRLISISDGALMSVLNRNSKTSISFLKLLSARQQAMLAKMSC